MTKYFLWLTTVLIIILTCLACSQTGIINTPRMPTSISFQTSIPLPFVPDKICYCAFSKTFLLLNKQENIIFRIDQKGKMLQKIGEFGFEKGQFVNTSDIATDSFGNLFVADKVANKVVKFDERGPFVNSVSFEETYEPELIAIKDNGELLLYDAAHNEIYCFDNRRKLRYSLGKFILLSPKALETSSDLNFVLDKGRNSILIFDNFGGIVSTIEVKDRIIDVAATKNFLYYIDSSGNIFCYKTIVNINYQLDSLFEHFLGKQPHLLIAYNEKIGIVAKNRLYVFELNIKNKPQK